MTTERARGPLRDDPPRISARHDALRLMSSLAAFRIPDIAGSAPPLQRSHDDGCVDFAFWRGMTMFLLFFDCSHF
jgi:hypothetical protein